jgi:hypothetical protein
MRVAAILRRLVSSCLPCVHARRFAVVVAAVEALARARRLSVSELGRALVSATAPKHSIKRVDRLLSNPKLQIDAPRYFAALARFLLANVERPVVLVDWTELSSGFHAIVAAVPRLGRALPIYVEVQPEKLQNNSAVEQRFLRQLSSILPPKCRPIIVTDAGFRGPFFRAVTSLGWDFVGRLRGMVSMRAASGRILGRSEVLAMAGRQPRDFGDVVLYPKARHPITKPLAARAVLGSRPRTRKRAHQSRITSRAKRKAAQGAREPWFLATSLRLPVSEILAIYASRMQIEETFRDTKNPRWGCSLRYVRCGSAARFAALLLIASLAIWVLTMIGAAAEQSGLRRRYQANTTARRVLSLFLLGATIVRRSELFLLPRAALFSAVRRAAPRLSS